MMSQCLVILQCVFYSEHRLQGDVGPGEISWNIFRIVLTSFHEANCCNVLLLS